MNTTPTPHLSNELTLDAQLLPLVTRRQELALQAKALQAAVDELTSEITGALVREGLNELEVGEYRVKYIMAERRTLDKGRLVELGVGTDVIAKAEKVSSFGRIDIRERKSL
jgi:N6-adenosine-specific RNA methylase IME4